MLDVLKVLGVVAVVLYQVGCGPNCGVGPALGPNSDGGVVTFDMVAMGSSQQLQVPFQDSVDTDEVIDGVSITGPDAAAFTVLAKYPIPLPAGTQVSLQIQFTPTHAGDASATLTLQTQDMGPSPVELAGTGVAAGK